MYGDVNAVIDAIFFVANIYIFMNTLYLLKYAKRNRTPKERVNLLIFLLVMHIVIAAAYWLDFVPIYAGIITFTGVILASAYVWVAIREYPREKPKEGENKVTKNE